MGGIDGWCIFSTGTHHTSTHEHPHTSQFRQWRTRMLIVYTFAHFSYILDISPNQLGRYQTKIQEGEKTKKSKKQYKDLPGVQ